jgi:hypothetical protein
MGFFLETLFGGLMVGMLYSLIAIGFVLIYKASGVFNFAQGAMVLFAALAMARFAEWLPRLTGLNNKFIDNLLAFIGAALVMVALAWLVQKLVLGKLVNQEGITLLMATLGINYFLEGAGQALFGNDIYKIDVGLPLGRFGRLLENLPGDAFSFGPLAHSLSYERHFLLRAAGAEAYVVRLGKKNDKRKPAIKIKETRGERDGILRHADVDLVDVVAEQGLARAFEEVGDAERRHQERDALLVDELAEDELLDKPG